MIQSVVQHPVIWLLIALLLVGAAVGGSLTDSSGRVVLLGLAVIHGFVTWRTDFTVREKQPFVMPDREEMGRIAGRLSGNAYKAQVEQLTQYILR